MNQNRPKLSVISIAKRDDEFETLRASLATQTYRNFEFVSSTLGRIPEAWNDAISRARGQFLVFTESDSVPLTNRWLEEIAATARQGCIMKGIEIRPSDLDLCNLVCDAEIFRTVRFDESFVIGEDTELFAHLRRLGRIPEFVNGFPVIHRPLQSWKKTISRGFRRGMYVMKIIYLHGRTNLDDVNTRSHSPNYGHPVSNRVGIIVENVLVLVGLVVGTILYVPVLLAPNRRAEEQGAMP